MAHKVKGGGPEVRPPTWRAEAIPNGWRPDQVSDMFELEQLELIAKNWRRGGSSWVAKATRPGNQDTVSSVIDSADAQHEITQESKQPFKSKSIALKPEKSVQMRPSAAHEQAGFKGPPGH
eukprot:s534_g15.t1